MRRRMRLSIDKRFGCLVMIIVPVINTTIGTWSITHILSWFGVHNSPLFARLVLGLILAELSIPIALIGVLLKAII